MRITLFSGLIAIIGIFLADDTALAQPRGFGSEAMLERLDQDGNGRLDSEEISQTRFPIADMAQRAGIDSSRGLDKNDLDRIFSQMPSRGGDRGGRGGFGRGGFGGGGFGDRDGRDGDREGSGGRGRGGDDSRESKAPEPLPRVTMDLQGDYVPGDQDADGQISLAEWLRWKSRAALADFLVRDRNADGILTPRELARPGRTEVDFAALLPGVNPAALPGYLGPPASSLPSPAGGGSLGSNPGSPSDTPVPAATATAAAAAKPEMSPSADVARYAASAERAFRLLDRDQDGNITDLEWRRSRLLPPKFEAAGADMSQPMPQETFVEYYVQFSTAGR